jgi:predicted MFS family arabinose efflux permease
MLAGRLARRLSRLGLHYSWVVLAVVFALTVVTAGAMALPGALILPLERQFGWSAEDISTAVALRLLIYGLMAPFAASLIDRIGLRRVMIGAALLIGVGLALSLAMSQVWQLTLLWGVMVGIGAGLTALVLGAVVAARWFTKRRGLALGVLTAGAAAGQLIFLPLAAWLERGWGWRAALAPTLVGLVGAAALVALLMADRPADLGLAAFGEAAGAPPAPAARRGGELRTLGEIAGSGAFWILAATFFICGLSTNGLIQTHFIALCSDFGVGSVTSASTLALMGAFDFVGTIGSGWLSDRYDNRALLFCYYGLRGLSLIYLPGSSFSIYGLSLFAAFYGLDWVATVPPTVRLTAEAFGRERAGAAFGWIYAAHMAGAATAAYGAGYSRSVLQTYLPALYAAGALCIVAAALVWLIEKRPADAPAPAPASA